ncbi:MAG: (2Fe-2S)-binding protein [Deltaproteobacteria bacterium]|nr:(2Fe-2S)-binding protein [Deltaproteobacteria bacterium]
MTTIKVNGIDYTAEKGNRLLLVLGKNGIRVPHLCFHHALTPAAACRLCVVLAMGIIPDGCIRCRLCIRVCSEIIGAKALKMVKKEGRNYVAPSENGDCIGCLTCTNICPTQAIYFEDDGNVRTVLVRDEVVGRHTLERCQICGNLYATIRFLEHVKKSEGEHPEEKEEHHHCPTCTKLYYRKNMRLTQPKFTSNR